MPKQPQPQDRDDFFIVWSMFEQLPPRVTFETVVDAVDEADARARRNPGVDYFVLKTVRFVTHDPLTEREPKATRARKAK
jgi:hypothetical protein